MTRTSRTFTRPFNSPVETGLRSLVILSAVAPQRLDLQKLTYLDYLLVHSGDVDTNLPSLHAPVPYRSGEWLIKRQLLESGLLLLIERELVNLHFDDSGISYSAADLASHFLENFKTKYAKELRQRANWLYQRFGNVQTKELESFMISNLAKWGGEFTHESMFRGTTIE